MTAPAVSSSESIQGQIRTFGQEVLRQVRQEQPSIFNTNFWTGKLLAWSMTKPELKVQLLRLVDVLPTLRTSGAVAQHAEAYLADAVASLSPVLSWGLKGRGARGLVSSVVVRRSVREMAKLFIAGETPQGSAKILQRMRGRGLSFTVDLLGEFCVSEKEALVYQDRYLEAVAVLSKAADGWKERTPIIDGHAGEQSPVNLSVKLTALYSQCGPLNFSGSVDVLAERLSKIVAAAAEAKASLYIDAEDSANNPIIYEVYKRVFGEGPFKDFPLPGIVVQAYARDAGSILEDLLLFAKKRGSPIAVRLVEGAYWDYETITSRQQNWQCPLFAHKDTTDANYEALSRTLIDQRDLCLPAFASHNIRSLAHACCYAKARGLTPADFELQMLYGMAEPIARAFSNLGYLVRLYVPLGDMVVGMGYLVRRLLENTSNESFLKHTFHDETSADELLAEPHFHKQDIKVPCSETSRS